MSQPSSRYWISSGRASLRTPRRTGASGLSTISITMGVSFLALAGHGPSPRHPRLWFQVSRGLHDQRQAHQVVVVTGGGIDEEVHRAARTVGGARHLHLAPELRLLRRAVGGVHLQAAPIYGGEQVVPQPRLRFGAEPQRPHDAGPPRLPHLPRP